MNPTHPEMILLVDDNAMVLQALARQHRKLFNIKTANGGEAALEKLEEEGPFAVVVSDFKMPLMDGITFLGKVRDRWPDTIRIMLTGEAQLEVAINAVNQGRIFRFMNKPCEKEQFDAVLCEALEQFRLKQAEKLLLEKTLRGSIQVLSDILAIVNPAAFGRAARIRYFVSQLVRLQDLEDPWMYETASLLSQIGCVAIPGEIIDMVAAGDQLSSEQQEMYGRHPAIARDLLANIPRLEAVAEMIALMFTPFRDRAPKAGDRNEEIIVHGSRILAIAHGFEELIRRGALRTEAIDSMRKRDGMYDPSLLSLLESIELPDEDTTVRTMAIDELRIGSVLDEEVKNRNGMLLVAHGQEITHSMLERLKNYAHLGHIEGTVRVRMSVTRCETKQPVLK